MTDTIMTIGGERKLGCLPPTTFPCASDKTFGDAFPSDVFTLDKIRAELAGKVSMYGRREYFKGRKYVRDQGPYGACNGWSTAGVLSRIRELRGEPYVCLSGADAYSQMNGGRDDGSVLADGMKIVEANGIAPEAMVPLNKIYDSQITREAKAARVRFKGFKAYPVDTEAELGSALLLGRAAVVAVHVTNQFNAQDGDGVNLGGNGVGNHSVGVHDIRVGKAGDIQFDMFNSWDISWGSGGYTWLTWEKHLKETVKYHRFWVLVSTGDDPGDGSTPPAAN